ncbi:MAG: 5-(carboxyamino)imidazole ribonucleotide synthase [Alphaproteobacteria bacterium]|nr:5-(carboxyamino)imidazole ribonucleotide synthase [Alphaproteobacteria bacterium]
MPQALAPGSTIGILGGGQLGRMTALAAANLGYRCHVLTPERDSPAAQVAAAATVADYRDEAALDRFAASCQVVTFEFENVPFEAAARLASRVPVRPRPEILRVTQDRVAEKSFVNGCGIATTQWAAVRGPGEIAAAVQRIGLPAVLKTARMGYDGKGQIGLKARSAVDGDALWTALWGNAPRDAGSREAPVAILEAYVNFACEVSVIVARGLDGRMQAFPPAENVHRDHILWTSTVPARVSPLVLAQAERAARTIAERLDLVGLIAVEMFVGHDGRVLVNELAPRPHNSGHWTMDACRTSQFEQLVRAICGLPLGSVERHSDVVMTNLIGAEVDTWRAVLAEPDAKLHVYGKAEARPGRKMGHVNRLVPRESYAKSKLGDVDPAM